MNTNIRPSYSRSRFLVLIYINILFTYHLVGIDYLWLCHTSFVLRCELDISELIMSWTSRLFQIRSFWNYFLVEKYAKILNLEE